MWHFLLLIHVNHIWLKYSTISWIIVGQYFSYNLKTILTIHAIFDLPILGYWWVSPKIIFPLWPVQPLYSYEIHSVLILLQSPLYRFTVRLRLRSRKECPMGTAPLISLLCWWEKTRLLRRMFAVSCKQLSKLAWKEKLFADQNQFQRYIVSWNDAKYEKTK